jgi:hypothetical protein
MRWPDLRSARPSRVSGCDVILKIVVLFLVGMGVLAMFGKLKFPGQARLQSARCPKCRRYRIGRGPCSCGHKG